MTDFTLSYRDFIHIGDVHSLTDSFSDKLLPEEEKLAEFESRIREETIVGVQKGIKVESS